MSGALPARRGDRLGPYADRRAQPQRHQRRRSAGAGRMVHRRCACRRHRSLELMVAVRPNFHQPALFAKQAANIDNISGGRLALNVVSSWWAEEATQYGLQFDQHDDRYARTTEWLQVVEGLWTPTALQLRRRSAISSRTPSASRSRCESRARHLRRRRKRGRQDNDRRPVRRLSSCTATPSMRSPPKIADMEARRERAGKPPMQLSAWPPSPSSATPRQKPSAEVARITTDDPQSRPRASTISTSGFPALN